MTCIKVAKIEAEKILNCCGAKEKTIIRIIKRKIYTQNLVKLISTKLKRTHPLPCNLTGQNGPQRKMATYNNNQLSPPYINNNLHVGWD